MTEPPGPDPTSLHLPEPEPEPIYDTGSDGWWRAQAKAQREAAQRDPVAPPSAYEPPAPLPPPELVEPQVLVDPLLPTGPGPLDSAWVAPEEVWGVPALHDAPEPPVDASLEPAAEPTLAPVPEAAPSLPRPVTVPPPQTWYDEPVPVRASSDGGGRGGPGRAVVGALIAVLGVALGIGALLLVNKDEPKGTPTVSLPRNLATTASATPTATQPAPTASPSATSASSSPTAQTAVTTAPSPTVAPFVDLTVLNNSTVHHLAERAAAKFRAGGWPVPATGNYSGGTITTTTIYYPAGQRASAERFARQFGVRVLARFAGLPGHGMTVVVTRDFTA